MREEQWRPAASGLGLLRKDGRARRRRALALLAAVALATGAVLAVRQAMLSRQPSGPLLAPLAAAALANMHTVPAAQLTGVACSGCHWLPRPVAGRPGLLPSLKDQCLQCHPQQKKQMGYVSVHPPFKSGECTACHQAHISPGQSQPQPGFLKVPARDLCLTCHADKRQQQALAFAHPPFANGQCASCHDPHASQVEPILRAQPKQLCFTCHQKEAAALKLPLQHPPFESGDCRSCHSPHASDQPGQLRAPLKEVCFSCHAGRIARMDTSHRPVREGWCTSCHQPHASKYKTLLVAPGGELCLTCHRK